MGKDWIPEGFYQINAYSNGSIIVVLGTPDDELPDEHPLTHNCDDMGCGSVGPHVVAVIPVQEPIPQLEWGKIEPPPPYVPSWEADK